MEEFRVQRRMKKMSIHQHAYDEADCVFDHLFCVCINILMNTLHDFSVDGLTIINNTTSDEACCAK